MPNYEQPHPYAQWDEARDEALVQDLAALLEDQDRRVTLVDAWWPEPGAGWVRPDWPAIARLAVGAVRAAEQPEGSAS